MPDTFNPTLPPQTQPSGKKTFFLDKVRFGDGYQQITGRGINTSEQSWPLTWKGTASEITPIKAFFDSHIGASFFWTPPLDTVRRFQIDGYDLIPDGLNYTISATFLETFGP